MNNLKTNQAKWERNFEDLAEYKRLKINETGRWDGKVPAGELGRDGRRLGAWVNTQRYSKWLSHQRKTRLDDLGLIFHSQQEQWQDEYNALVRYIERQREN